VVNAGPVVAPQSALRANSSLRVRAFR
jgi:hypothetical protein